MGGTPEKQTKVENATRDPWAPAVPQLQGLLGKLGGVSTEPTTAENSAFQALAGNSNFMNQFSPQATGLANTLLAGGGPDRTGMINNAYSQYQAALTPFARGDYVNPESNPALQKYIGMIGNDVQNRVNGMFAGAGRDMSGANLQTLSRGISEGTAPTLMNAYNSALGNQLSAINSLYGAGGQTAGLLSNLDQTRLGNQQAGLGVAQTAQGFANDPFNQQLAIEAQRRGISMDTLQRLVGMTSQIAGLGGSSNSTSTTTKEAATSPLQTGLGAAMAIGGLATGNPMLAMGGLSTAAGGLGMNTAGMNTAMGGMSSMFGGGNFGGMGSAQGRQLELDNWNMAQQAPWQRYPGNVG